MSLQHGHAARHLSPVWASSVNIRGKCSHVYLNDVDGVGRVDKLVEASKFGAT